MNVLFIASGAVVATDPPQSRKLFIDAVGRINSVVTLRARIHESDQPVKGAKSLI